MPVTAGAPQFIMHKNSKRCQVKTDFRTYLKYVEDPQGVDALFKDKWSKGGADVLHGFNLPLYCGNLRLASPSREKGFFEIVLGGDHAISYAVVAAFHGFGPLNIVWFDAHTDFCAWLGGRWHNHTS